MLTASDLSDDQLACIDFIRGGEDSLIAADVGTGKTVIAATPAAETNHRFLVLAPPLVATDTWPKEFELWEHLRRSSIAVAAGKTPAQRLKAINSDAQFVTLNYENLAWLMDTFDAKSFPFTGLIADELDKLKTVTSARFKKFRNRVKDFDLRIGLTGTLVPKDLTDVWSQVYVVDGGESFGRSFYKWRQQYFYPVDFQQRKWMPLPNTEKFILDSISDITFRLKGKGLPIVQFLPPHFLKLDSDVAAKYSQLERTFLLAVDKNDKTRVIDAKNAAVLSGKLQQICAGFSYLTPQSCPEHGKPARLDPKGKYRCGDLSGHLIENDVHWHTAARFDWLDDLLARHAKEKLQTLIFYQFKEELALLQRRLSNFEHIGGGVTPTQALKSIDAWNRGKLPTLALHPASAGHGLNLQHSGAHNIVFLTVPWSGGMLTQAIGRLARRGNSAPTVFIHNAPFSSTIDETVLAVASGRVTGMESFLDAIERAA